MPRYPNAVPRLSVVHRTPYSQFVQQAAAQGGPIYKLHIGDTYMSPPKGCRMEDLRESDYPGLHCYAPVGGRSDLIDAIAERTRVTQDKAAERAEILVTAGATGGLYAAAVALLEPTDEVIVLAPAWPLILNAIRCAGAKAIATPFFERAHDPQSAAQVIRDAIGPNTTAIYWNTPNNPTGRLIPESWLQAMSEVARESNLWIISDEVYEHYNYGEDHCYSRCFAPERTLAAYSFSKAYGMAGNRCGDMVGPESAIEALKRVTRNSFYAVTTAAQIAGVRTLLGPGDHWAEDAARQYQAVGYQAAVRLGITPPRGGAFLFVDVGAALDHRGLDGLLSDCADRGLLAAPGTSFGPYPNHVRICFTSMPPEDTMAGVEILAQAIGV